MSSLKDPFAKNVSKNNTTASKPIQKTDSTRETVKKQLINALDKSKDKLLQDLKLSSEEIAKEIEEEVFVQNDNSSKSKAYRDKIRKLEMRLKGPRNNFIRELLKKGKLSVNEYCNLNDKDLMDDKYYKKYEENTTENKDDQKSENPSKTKPIGNRIVKPPAFKHIKMPKPPVIHTSNKNINTNDNNLNEKKENNIISESDDKGNLNNKENKNDNEDNNYIK